MFHIIAFYIILAFSGGLIFMLLKNKQLLAKKEEMLLSQQEEMLNLKADLKLNSNLEQRQKEEMLNLKNLFEAQKSQLQTIFDNSLQNEISQNQQRLEELKQSSNLQIDSYVQKYETLLKQKELSYQKELDSLKQNMELERKNQELSLKQSFEEISNKLLDEKVSTFNLKQEDSLKPLQEYLKALKIEVNEQSRQNQEKQIKLSSEIESLMKLNLKLSEDANALTKALKGDNKIQGNWGEMILEQVLQSCGFEKGVQYLTQENLKDDDGKSLRPDVIIKLPENRDIVVDSKVSLIDYLNFIEQNTASSLKGLFMSLESHYKNLSSKKYNEIVGKNSNKIDFVLMFIPIEGVFSQVAKNNSKLLYEAFNKGVVICSPSTLMPIIKMINFAWRADARDKNSEKILKVCESMIKKFDGFQTNMNKLKDSIDKASRSFEDANAQLITGKGSIGSSITKLDGFLQKANESISNEVAL